MKGLTADALPSRHQDEITTSGVGVQQEGKLMITEGLKGERGKASGQEVCRNRPGQEED